MQKFLLGRKIGMTQLINENDEVVPITVVQVEDTVVLRKKTVEKDGYAALVLAYGQTKESKCIKPHLGIFKKAEMAVKKAIKEFRTTDVDKYNVGDVIGLDMFAPEEKVNVRSVTIGRGFTGSIKRWNFHRGPMGHGSKSHRIPGSIGSGTHMSGVTKGKKMAGHYGCEKVTIMKLKVVGFDKEKNLVFIKGSIPGKKHNIVEIYN